MLSNIVKLVTDDAFHLKLYHSSLDEAPRGDNFSLNLNLIFCPNHLSYFVQKNMLCLNSLSKTLPQTKLSRPKNKKLPRLLTSSCHE